MILGPITLDPAQSAQSTTMLLNQSKGTYVNTANTTGYDPLGYRVDDHDDAACTINGKSTPVGGEIYPAVTDEQRLTLGLALALCLAAFWRIKKQFTIFSQLLSIESISRIGSPSKYIRGLISRRCMYPL